MTDAPAPVPVEEEVVCPRCLLNNAPAAAFCADCGAPIGMVANVDPIQQIYAEGFTYRSAVEGPPRPIILAGMWLIFVPMGALSLCLLWDGLPRTLPENFLLFGLAIASGVVLYRTTQNFVLKTRQNRKTPPTTEVDV